MVPWEPAVGVGRDGHGGLCCHPLQQQCQFPPAWSLGEHKPPASGMGAQKHSQGWEQRCLCQVSLVSRSCNSCGHHQLPELQPAWSPSGSSVHRNKERAGQKIGWIELYSLGLVEQQGRSAAELLGCWNCCWFIMLQTSLQLSLVPWTQPCPGLTRAGPSPCGITGLWAWTPSCRNTSARGQLCLFFMSQAGAKSVEPQFDQEILQFPNFPPNDCAGHGFALCSPWQFCCMHLGGAGLCLSLLEP